MGRDGRYNHGDGIVYIKLIKGDKNLSFMIESLCKEVVKPFQFKIDVNKRFLTADECDKYEYQRLI